MSETFATFTSRRFKDLKEAIINFCMFLPYFFSVEELGKTLFAPWKQITTKKTKPGYSLDEATSRLGDNLVSRFMGFILRASVLIAYLTLQTLFVLLLPLVILFAILFLPIDYFLHRSLLKPELKKQQLRQHFIKTRTTDEKNSLAIEKWFELYWASRHQIAWWHKERLFAVPPVGRDWNAGYTPTLDRFSLPVPETWAETRNFIDRVSELSQIETALSKSQDANVVIVGEEGVGRDIIVRAFGKRLYEGKSNATLAFKRILKLDIDKLVADTADFTKRTELLATILTEAAAARNIILYIPEIEHFISGEEGRTDFSGVLAEFASSPVLQFITTTTPRDYQKYLYSKPALANTFERVEVSEITLNDALEIMLISALTLEERHQVIISYEAVEASVSMAEKFMKDKPLPESAIDLLDEACVAAGTKKTTIVTPDLIGSLIEQKTHIPTTLGPKLQDKLAALSVSMAERVIGQTEATQKIAATLSKSFVLESDKPRPLASFVLLGPTGVGKTETAKTLAEALFDDEAALIRFDMSLFQTPADIGRLVGSASSSEPGLLTTAVRERHFGVLLLDEFEKANPNLLNIFLTILDEGYFTSVVGERVDCTHLIIVATSNAGADMLFAAIKEGQTDYQTLSDNLINSVIAQKIYTPELLNRFDGVIVYHPLDTPAITTIARRIVTQMAKKLFEKQQITLVVDDLFLQSLIDKSYDERFGARNMQRIIESDIEDKIAAQILNKSLVAGMTVTF